MGHPGVDSARSSSPRRWGLPALWSGPALSETLKPGQIIPKHLTGRTAHCVPFFGTFCIWRQTRLERVPQRCRGRARRLGGAAPCFSGAHGQLKIDPRFPWRPSMQGAPPWGPSRWPPGPKPLITCCHLERMADGSVEVAGSGSRSERQLAAPDFLVQTRKENLGGLEEGVVGLLGPLSEGGGRRSQDPRSVCRYVQEWDLLTGANGSVAPTVYGLLRSRLTHVPHACLLEGPP